MYSKYFYDIALGFIPHVGPIQSKHLIEQLGSAERLFKASQKTIATLTHIYPKAKESLSNNLLSSLKKAEHELKLIEQHNIQVIHITDTDYPYRLKECADAPLLLFKKGQGETNPSKALGIVGTRKATFEGIGVCKKIVQELSHLPDLCIVSGLALGIDIASHQSAIEHHLTTWGVLGSGLGNIYPPEHQKIIEKMLSRGGVMSEFPFHTPPTAMNFPRRNRIVAGIIDGLLVIESDVYGGSMITARLAHTYHREVMAIPGPINKNNNKGCHLLIKQNLACLVEDAKDILNNMSWGALNSELTKQQETQLQMKFPFELSPNHVSIIQKLQSKPRWHIDELSVESSIKSSDVLTILFELEYNFVVESFPGNMYSIKNTYVRL